MYGSCYMIGQAYGELLIEQLDGVFGNRMNMNGTGVCLLNSYVWERVCLVCLENKLIYCKRSELLANNTVYVWKLKLV